MCYHKRFFYACYHYELGPCVSKCEDRKIEEARARAGLGEKPTAPCKDIKFHGVLSVKSPSPCNKCELPSRRALEFERFPDEFSRERLKKMTAEAQKKAEEEANQVSELDVTDATANDV